MEVHNKASNMANRAELSNYPVIIDINKKTYDYLSYLQDKDNNSMVTIPTNINWALQQC